MDSRLSDAVFAAPAAPTLGGPGPLAPVPAQPKPRTARVRVTSEAVGVRGAMGGYYRSLPPWIDDLTREYGPETYERMQLDDQVSSSLRALCHGVLSDELVLRPGVDDKKDPDFGAAKGALGFCERATWQQTGGLDQWLFTMLKGSVGGGNRVSETVYRPEESGKDAGKWVLDRLKVKPRRSIAFAVDSCNNLAGFLGLPPGGAGWGGLAWGTAFDPADPPDNFLPRDKFCALAWDPHDEDPRGSAILRCVYEPWWAKLQAARDWLAHLAQFGSPGLVGTTAPGADSSAPTDAYGNPVPGDVLTPEQDMANKVMEHRNGGVHILPNGATLDVLQSSNAGDAFLKKVDSCDRAIAQGILLAMRAVMQSRFGSRADAEQGQDVAGLQTRYMKRWLARMVTEDLLRPLVRINYGPDAARRLCPYASLSPVEHQDLGASLVAVSGAWKNGLIKNSQLPWVYEQFGMPPATPEELAPPPPQPVGGQPAAPGGPGEPPPAAPPAPPPAPPPGPPDLGFSDPDAGPDLSGLGDLLNLSRQEVLDALFDAAIDSFDLALPDASFNVPSDFVQQIRPEDSVPFYSPDQPRVPAGQPGGGRWAGGVSSGTTAARDAASDAVRAFARGQGPASVRDIHAIAGHLAKLTVSQIHALKAQHGLKGSAPNKAALVAKLAQRFRDARAAAGTTPGVAVSAPLPPSAYSPMTPPASPAPAPASVLNRGANVITGAPAKAAVPVVPFAAERAWETGKPEPGVLNGIPFAPAPPKFWEKVKDVDVGEPPPARPVNRAGVLIREPDGRVWIVQPTNQFGNRKHTLPGGGVEPGLTDQQNALKEVWEETGLQVEITGYAGDFEDSNNGNNGRLYLGRRVGGAPWDAKVESFIVSNKTGNPAAESETVTLVTPERAAQLLHRTDDLAQLAMVHPISIKTNPAKNVISKIVGGVQPAALDYARKKTAAGESPGDATLHAVQEARGFNGKPAVVKRADFDALLSQGNHIEMLRGIAAIPPSSAHGATNLTPHDMAEQFKTGEHFPGHGMFGVGTYADSTKGYKNAATGSYSAGGEVMRIALPKTAKVVKFAALKDATGSNAPGDYKVPAGKNPADYWRGVHAALAGYDAIHVDDPSRYGHGYYVILNRSILTVQKEQVDRNYTIK